MIETEKKRGALPRPVVALIPLLVLVVLVSFTVKIFGSDSLGGGSQVALLLSSSVAVGISMCLYGMPWQAFTDALKKTIGGTSEAIVILLVIGMIGGSWMISGVVPTLICYGLQVISPDFFLICTCIICAVVSVLTGSSWSTIATIGVAFIGIGTMLGISTAWTAGAIISGAYFGDKISPLSDTTVLASSTSGTDLFTHIRYMLFTTVPSFVITLVIFGIAGFLMKGSGAQVDAGLDGLRATFNITPWTLLVPLFTGVLIARKAPSLITLFLSALAGIVAALILQPGLVAQVADGGINFSDLAKGASMILFGPTQIETGNAVLNDLVSTGGMAGMLETVWLILCALTFGAAMASGRMLESMTGALVRHLKSTGGLVSSTVATGIMMNLTTSDQYLSIILTASSFKEIYRKMGYESRLLSRTTEDAVTVTSVLIPWNTCGMTQSTVLGVATVAYLPFCFFNIISPLMTILVASAGWKINRTDGNRL